VRPFTSPVPFVILQHLAEARNSIATARMTHASIKNCELITGTRFEHDARVNELLADSRRRNVLLFPRPGAAGLDQFLAQEPNPVFWVIDAKWAQVPKMLRFSPNVRALEAVAFEPPGESIFSSIRTQPHAGCLSTLEAVFHVIDCVKRHRREAGTEHHALLDVFRHLVRQQLEFVRLDVRRHGAARALRRLSREPVA
jgi:DTW domain-containing protein YfiP